MRLILFLFMSLGLLSGCFSSQVGPTEDDFKAFFTTGITKGTEITDMTIEAAENVGTEVEPVVKSRIKGEIVLIEDFYKSKGRVAGKKVLVKTKDKGMKSIILGVAVSKRKLDKWKIRFKELSITPDIKSYPLSKWRKGSYVIKGSAEEKKLRVQQEAENKAWRKDMQKLRKFMTGIWKTKKPILERNSQYVYIGSTVNTGSRENILYSINIPKGTNLKGTGTATISGSKNRHRAITVDISYQIFDVGEVKIKELQNKCIDTWCTGDGWTLTSTTKGALLGSARGYRTSYNMTMFRK